MSFAIIILSIFTIIGLCFLWVKQRLNYWVMRNVPEDPKNRFYKAKKYKHPAYFTQCIYKNMKNCGSPVVGASPIIFPSLIVLDLDLIKSILTADFETFPDRGLYHNLHDDPLSENLIRLKGEKWRRMRTKLSPTFTSGKIKNMFPLINEIAERFVHLVEQKCASEHTGKYKFAQEVQIRDLCARFTTDVIGSVAFGIDCNSLNNEKTEFRVMGEKAMKNSSLFKDLFGFAYPKLLQALHVKTFPNDLIRFYSRIVEENIKYREENDVKRNDFLDILIELKNKEIGNESKLSIGEVIGQAFLFFIGGFDTSSSTMTFCLFELCQSQALQEKARQNVMDCLKKHKGVFTYECMKDMQYLNQVLLETLRKYPVAPHLRRICRKPYKIPNSNIIIEKNTNVLIPAYAIHNDPEYHPEPDTFDPERFSPEQMQQRHPMTYLPFGAGPRVCIAERFGKMQTLIGLAKLLQNFRFTPSSNTPDKIIIDYTKPRVFSIRRLDINVQML